MNRIKNFFAVPCVLVAILCLSTIVGAEDTRTPTFVHDIVPILTKADCNTGACHAKAGNGQRGFRLSLLGFEPQEDYDHIVKEARGRRVFPPAPDQSLIVLKAANIVPHGGGEKLKPGSENYRTLVRWIGEGLVYQNDEDGVIESLQVSPDRMTMQTGSEQHLKVTALYSNGSSRDVTSMALYETNNESMGEAHEDGLVETHGIPGNFAVMVRYGGKVATSNISIPLGAPVDDLPEAENFIDELVFANLEKMGIPPSPVCDDATFLRRVSIDISGRLPTGEETRAFLEDTSPDKRTRVIDTLLDSPEYADYFANKWTALLKNQRESKADITANFAFHSWVRDSLLANKPYNEFVTEILAATGTIVANPPVAWYKRVKEPTQQLEDVAQLFLGVRMQCAQCHHHPFERWSQHDYYALGAFFSQVGRKPTAIAGEDLIFHKRGVAQMENRKTSSPVKPAALGSPAIDISPDDDPRLELAEWMSRESNPFFATALVNRYWKHFFKKGLVEPEDDIRDTNPASNPELLGALAESFVDSGFDLKQLIRDLTRSKTYQLSSQPNQHNDIDLQNYSHYYPKRLQAEVLLDSVDRLTGATTSFANLPLGTSAVALPDNSYNASSSFLKIFGRPEGSSVCECERVQSSSLGQSLHLMNSKEVKTKLSRNGGRAELLSKQEGPVEDAITELYLTAFSRLPTGEEVSIAKEHVVKARQDSNGKPLAEQAARRLGYEDLIWALMTTKEFLYNH